MTVNRTGQTPQPSPYREPGRLPTTTQAIETPLTSTTKTEVEDQTQTTRTRQADFDPVATPVLPQTQTTTEPARLPSPEIVTQSIQNYTQTIEKYRDTPREQLSPEAISEINRAEREMASHLNSYGHYVAANKGATAELEQLTRWMQEIKPTRQTLQRIRQDYSLTSLINLPDSKA